MRLFVLHISRLAGFTRVLISLVLSLYEGYSLLFLFWLSILLCGQCSFLDGGALYGVVSLWIWELIISSMRLFRFYVLILSCCWRIVLSRVLFIYMDVVLGVGFGFSRYYSVSVSLLWRVGLIYIRWGAKLVNTRRSRIALRGFMWWTSAAFVTCGDERMYDGYELVNPKRKVMM